MTAKRMATDNKKNESLLERFLNSKSLTVLSEDYQNKIQELIVAGDEKTIRAIIKFLDDEAEAKKFLDDFIEDAVKDGIKPVLQTYKKEKIIYDDHNDEVESQIAAEKILKKIS
jgi:hypothetical protein